MEDMKVFIINVGKCNEAEFVGEWFALPVDYDQMAERLDLHGDYTEYAIHDYELPFEVNPYTPIEEINLRYDMLRELPEAVQQELDSLLPYFRGVVDLYYSRSGIRHYPDCENMEDIARCYIEVNGLADAIPDALRRQMDDEALIQTLEKNSVFVFTSHGAFEICG